MMSLFGGLAAASLAGVAFAQAAPAQPEAAPAARAGDVVSTMKAGLDKTDAEFSQVVVRRTTVVRRPVYRRPVVVRRTVVRRPVYRRPVVVHRRVYVR
jgi:hypothetical protein